jgi:flagellar assembly protein FliH
MLEGKRNADAADNPKNDYFHRLLSHSIMPAIIKATDRGRGIQPVAFNFNDIADKANEYLAKVRAEAVRIVTKAQAEADEIRRRTEDAAQTAGYEAGQKKGREEIEKIVDQRLATLLPALQGVIGEIRQARQSWLSQWETGGIHVAAAIARRIIRRELSRTPEISLAIIRETLELAAGSSQLRIHLNPEDQQTLGPRVEWLVKELTELGTAEIIPDPGVARGGCRVETSAGTIDNRLEAQLARIEEELSGVESGEW